MSAEITPTMDRVGVVPPSSQLSSVPSTSSFPSLASQSSADSDSTLEQHQEQETPARRAETTPSGALSSAAAPSAAAPRRSSPFQSLRPPRPLGSFHPLSHGRILLVAAFSFACLHSLTLAAVSEIPRNPRRRLEDEFTGKWNGKWTASQDDDYVYGCNRDGGCDDDARGSSGGGSMWIDDADALALTPDQIITYVSAGLLAFMTLLCCVCYPEIVTVTFRKLCGCCLGGKAAVGTGADGGVGDDGELEAAYLGGMQEEKWRKKKRRNSKSSNRSSSSRRSRDVELV